MWVDERKLRYAIALAFALGGVFAFLVRGDAWPFAAETLHLPPHATLIASDQLEIALSEDVYDENRITELSQKIVAIEPLAPLPFEAMLALELERELVDPEAATALAKATLERDARNLSARLFLVDQAMLDQNWDEAFAAFGRAYELWPTEAPEMRDMLYQSLTDTTWSEAFIARLERKEVWTQTFVQRLPIDSVKFETIVELHRPLEDLHQALLSKLQRRDMSEAHIAWAALRPNEAMVSEIGLIDPTFEGSTTLKPFNWDFDSNHAEIDVQNSGLYVEYRGRGQPTFASQSVFLPAGTYGFASRLSETPSEPAGDIVWLLRCSESRDVRMSVSVFDPVFGGDTGEVEFTVPETCPYQDLSLVGRPGTFTRRYRLVVDHIQIAQRRAQP